MKSYHQNKLIDQINHYLKSKGRNLQLEYGYCHGLTLLWLYKISQGQEEQFYKTIKKIIDHQDSNFDDIEIDMEKFINHIEWMQNSCEYVYTIQQFDIGKLLDQNREFSLSYLFSHTEFVQALKTLEQNKMIVLSGPSHTIGLYQKDNIYYLFDPNYHEGTPKKIESITKLKKEIVISLFKKFHFATKVLPITINVSSTGEIKKDFEKSKIKMYNQLTQSNAKLNVLGTQDISPLYIASEAGDETEVKILLSKNVKVNHRLQDGCTALLIAAQNGYTNIVKRLLQHKADPNICMHNLVSPLIAACEKGHEDVVKLLLDAHANVDHTDHEDESALVVAARENHTRLVELLLQKNPNLFNKSHCIPSLAHAITNRNWAMTILILNSVQSPLSSKDSNLLRKSRGSIRQYLHENSDVKITNPELNSLVAKETHLPTRYHLRSSMHQC